MLYLACIKKYLSVTDVEDIVNHANQGWQFDKMCDYHTSEIAISKVFEVDVPDYMEKNYLNTISTIPNIEVEWMETRDGHHIWNRNPSTGEWEETKVK